MTRWPVVVMACVLLAGCGEGADPVAGDEPITPAAIAAIAQEHVDLQPSRIAESDVFEPELGDQSTAAWLQYADVSLTVVVAPSSNSPLVCAEPTFFDECVADSVDGHDVTIAWQELEPEEDPGVVYLIDRRAREDVAVRVTGASITDDPRDLDLGVPLAQPRRPRGRSATRASRRPNPSSSWAPTWRSSRADHMRPRHRADHVAFASGDGRDRRTHLGSGG